MPDYDEIFAYVANMLKGCDTQATQVDVFPFRKRSEHIWRVYRWAGRLADAEAPTDKNALLLAALFHDAGYALSPDGESHAANSAALFDAFAMERGFAPKWASFVSRLIREHSKKALLTDNNAPKELILLMEADLLDECGAMSVLWDCMAEKHSYESAYLRIKKFSGAILDKNPMVTETARAYWEDKRRLIDEFLRQLETDLG